MGNLNSVQNTFAREKLPGKSRKFRRVGQLLITSLILIIKAGTLRFRGKNGNKRKINKACSSSQGRGRYDGLFMCFDSGHSACFQMSFCTNNKSLAFKHGLAFKISSESQSSEIWNPYPQTQMSFQSESTSMAFTCTVAKTPQALYSWTAAEDNALVMLKARTAFIPAALMRRQLAAHASQTRAAPCPPRPLPSPEAAFSS